MITHKGTQMLRTERLTLRRFFMDDAQAMFENWANDERVTRDLTWLPHESPEFTRQLLAGWCAAYDNLSTYNWAIIYEGTPIGNIRYECYCRKHNPYQRRRVDGKVCPLSITRPQASTGRENRRFSLPVGFNISKNFLHRCGWKTTPSTFVQQNPSHSRTIAAYPFVCMKRSGNCAFRISAAGRKPSVEASLYITALAGYCIGN